MRSATGLLVLASALALPLHVGGCAARTASAPPPTAMRDSYGHEMVTVAPGVMVIANYDEPIFYADRFYWRFYGGHWFRSAIYTGGWMYAPPPRALSRIKHPDAYVHYQPPAHQRYGRARPARRPQPPSMYQTPPRRLQQPQELPNGRR